MSCLCNVTLFLSGCQSLAVISIIIIPRPSSRLLAPLRRRPTVRLIPVTSWCGPWRVADSVSTAPTTTPQYSLSVDYKARFRRGLRQASRMMQRRSSLFRGTSPANCVIFLRACPPPPTSALPVPRHSPIVATSPTRLSTRRGRVRLVEQTKCRDNSSCCRMSDIGCALASCV